MEKERRVFQTDVDAKLCKACGYCQEVCPKGVFETAVAPNAQGYLFRIASYSDKCIGCLRCLMICPDFAITVNASVGGK